MDIITKNLLWCGARAFVEKNRKFTENEIKRRFLQSNKQYKREIFFSIFTSHTRNRMGFINNKSQEDDCIKITLKSITEEDGMEEALLVVSKSILISKVPFFRGLCTGMHASEVSFEAEIPYPVNFKDYLYPHAILLKDMDADTKKKMFDYPHIIQSYKNATYLGMGDLSNNLVEKMAEQIDTLMKMPQFNLDSISVDLLEQIVGKLYHQHSSILYQLRIMLHWAEFEVDAPIDEKAMERINKIKQVFSTHCNGLIQTIDNEFKNGLDSLKSQFPKEYEAFVEPVVIKSIIEYTDAQLEMERKELSAEQETTSALKEQISMKDMELSSTKILLQNAEQEIVCTQCLQKFPRSVFLKISCTTWIHSKSCPINSSLFGKCNGNDNCKSGKTNRNSCKAIFNKFHVQSGNADLPKFSFGSYQQKVPIPKMSNNFKFSTPAEPESTFKCSPSSDLSTTKKPSPSNIFGI